MDPSSVFCLGLIVLVLIATAYLTPKARHKPSCRDWPNDHRRDLYLSRVEDRFGIESEEYLTRVARAAQRCADVEARLRAVPRHRALVVLQSEPS